MNCVRRATAREPGRRDPPSILALTFMNDDTTCRQLRDHLDQAEPGSIPGTMTAHAASCPPCGRLLRRQARLVRMLESLPAAPSADVARPALPDVPGGRLLPLRLPAWAAAAAAAALVAAVVWHSSTPAVERVRVVGVVDVAGAPPQTDERLLALTAGVEAVAMRRPTEIR